jgi:hypothetical protein
MSELPILTELGEQSSAGFRRRVTRGGRTRVAVAATTVALAVALVLAFTIGGGAVHPPGASAAAQLRAVAHAAETRAVPIPGPRQFLFVRARVRVLVPIRASLSTPLRRSELGAPSALVEYAYWVSYSATRTGEIAGRLISVSFPTAAARRRWVALGRPSFAAVVPPRLAITPGGGISVGLSGITVEQLLSLPADPRTIERRLLAGATPNNVLAHVEQINQYPLSAKLQGAIYRALALVPGIRADGRVRALTGRAGTAFGTSNGRELFELIVDPATGAVLGTRVVSGGRVLSEEAVVARAITNRPGPPRR